MRDCLTAKGTEIAETGRRSAITPLQKRFKKAPGISRLTVKRAKPALISKSNASTPGLRTPFPSFGFSAFFAVKNYLTKTAAAALAMSSAVAGKIPSQNMPAIQTQMATLIGPDNTIGDTSAGFLLQ